MKLSKLSIALLLIQLALVSSIAAKYIYQRWRCPRAWTRTVAYDPELPMRGRYLAMVDRCEEQIARNVTANLFDRHIKPLFLD